MKERKKKKKSTRNSNRVDQAAFSTNNSRCLCSTHLVAEVLVAPQHFTPADAVAQRGNLCAELVTGKAHVAACQAHARKGTTED